MATIKKADADDGVKTDEIHKKLDPEQPIHRIGQLSPPGATERRPPSFRPNLTGPTIDGKGFDRPDRSFESCRRPAAVQAEAARRNKVLGLATAELARVVPAWVLVEPHVGFPPAFSEPNAAFQEVEGKLIRSFQTWTDFPVAQWHQWYDWNFHVEPADGYRHLPGPANKLEGLGGKTPVVKGAGNTMECEWDTGAFGTIPGSMFLPNVDWCWPMAGDFVWIAGRWIYDCGHANAQELTRTELHPCAAVATARWEGVEFKSDQTEIIWPPGSGGGVTFRPAKDTPAVPGIRFMFFASRNGGYKNFSSLANPNSTFDKNYRFIVDLPRIRGEGRTLVIDKGEATGVVPNPSLLVSFGFDAFSSNTPGKFQKKDPVITVIDPGNGKLPEQVIVEIPIDKLDPDTQAYGVVVSLGWHDQANVLAKRVVKCEVNIVSVELVSTQLLGSGLPWTLKFGVNGRWFRKEFPSLGPSVRLINRSFPFFLPLDHPTPAGADIRVNAHGKIVKPVGEFLKKPPSNRTLRLSGRVQDYDRDAVLAKDAIAVDIVEELTLMQASTLAQENDPIGIFDLKESVTAVVAAGGTKRFVQPALAVEEKKPLAELVFVNDTPGQEKVDYRLSFVIKTVPQTIP